MRSFISLLLVLSFILISYIGCGGAPTACPKIGDKAPNITLIDMDGNNVDLSIYAGKPIIINTWSDDCTHCKQEMLYFNEMLKDHSVKELIFISVNTLDGKNTISDFLSKNNYDFTVLRDYGRKTINAKFCLPGSGPHKGDPYTIFIDDKGYIKNIKIGPFTSKEELMTEVNKILPGS